MQREGAAKELLSNQLLNEILDRKEADAIERVVSLRADDQQRLESAIMVRAIRSVRSDLETLSKGKDNTPRTGAVA